MTGDEMKRESGSFSLSTFHFPLAALRRSAFHFPLSTLILLSTFHFSLSTAFAGSLRTRFTEVEMPDVPIGATVSPRLDDGTGYTLVNDSDRPLRVRLNAERPSFCEPVTPGPQYRPLPPSCKVSFDPQILDIAPHGTGAVLVAVSLPADPALAGRRFEVWLRAETLVGNAGVALVSRLRLSTSAQGAEVERSGKWKVESGKVESEKVDSGKGESENMEREESERETGEVRRETGEVRRETGEVRRETGEVRSEKESIEDGKEPSP